MKTKHRIKRPVTDPSSIAIETVMADIATFKNAERKITADLDAVIHAAREFVQPELTEISASLAILTAKAQAWAEAHPEKFAKKKSLELTHGTLGFRTGTPKVALLNRKWSWKKALKFTETSLPGFIRHVPEIDKDAILADFTNGAATAVELASAGLKVVQDESFYIEPNLTKLETRETTPATSKA